MKIYHYTNIHTLALILKNRTIRFNRLDRVDDVSEASAYGRHDIAKNLFVSCWTLNPKESIPQWHIYTDRMAGVRIELPEAPFHYRPLEPNPAWGFIKEGEIYSPIPWDELFTDSYFILPNIINQELFERKVRYVDSVQDVFRDAIDLRVDGDGKAHLKIDNLGEFAGVKDHSWAFQEEFRFVLFVLPSLPLPEDGFANEQFVEQLPSYFIQSIQRGVGPPIEYLDLDIDPNVIDEVHVTLGPMCSDGDRTIVEALLEKYTDRGSVRPSVLTGTIRQPSR